MTIPSASSVSRPVRPCGMASSRIARSRNGEATETSDDTDQAAASSSPVGAEQSHDPAQRHTGPDGVQMGLQEWLSLASSNRV